MKNKLIPGLRGGIGAALLLLVAACSSAVTQTLKRYKAAGVTDVCVRFAGTDQLAQLEQFIHHVAPAFGS